MKSYSAALSVASLVSSVAAHGYISSPAPRMPGDAMAAACGSQMFNNQNSDHYGNVQGQLQVANGQSDYDAAACGVWLCKGYQFDDNTANVQSYTAGQVIPMEIEIRAPHTGTANVSIVKTSTNSIIGEPLISWDEYAANSAPIPAEQTSFDITMPDVGSECATAGDCVIQWYWDARSIDQTYEGCIDFTIGGGSGSGGSGGNSATPPAATSAPAPTVPSATPTPSSVGATTPSASAAPAPVPTQGAGEGSSDEEEFTLDSFIAWLQEKAGASTSTKARRSSRVHARAF